MRRIGVRLETT